MDTEVAIKEVAEELENLPLQLPGQLYTYQQLHQQLAASLNYLITNDFSFLISVLYRLDISEKKLKTALSQPSDSTAGEIIAEIIIERQRQKIALRKSFKNNADIADDEKW